MILPAALTKPPVSTLPLVILPVELIDPEVRKLPPVMLPDALTIPAISNPPVLKVKILSTPPTLPIMLPLATGMFIVVVPLVNCDAAPTLPAAITPVRPEPLPVKSPAEILLVITALLADKLPDAVIATAVTSARLCIVPTLIVVPVTLRLLRVASPDEFRVPTTLTPVPVTVITLAVPAEEMVTLPLACGMLTLLVPFAMPVMPAVANNWLKLLLVLVNAVRKASPNPSLGVVPTLIVS